MANTNQPVNPSVSSSNITPEIQTKDFYYIQPTTSTANIMLILIIIIIVFVLLFNILYMYVSWDSSQCNGTNFMLAPLIGKDSQTTFKKCASNAMSDALNSTDTEYYKKINDLSKSVTDLSNNVVNTPAGSGTGSTAANFPTNYNSLLSTVDSIQSALSKILGSVALSSYLNNGVLQSTNSLQNGEISQLMNQYNTVENNIYNQKQASGIMAGMK
jgi:hypothetical protein